MDNVKGLLFGAGLDLNLTNVVGICNDKNEGILHGKNWIKLEAQGGIGPP